MFSILILKGLNDSNGNVWRCFPQQLYLVEATYKVLKQVCITNYVCILYILEHSLFLFVCNVYVLTIRMLKLVIHRIAILLKFSSLSLPSLVVVQGMPFHMFHLKKVHTCLDNIIYVHNIMDLQMQFIVIQMRYCLSITRDLINT